MSTLLRFKNIMRERAEFSESGNERLLSVSEYYGVKPRDEIVEGDEAISRADSLEGYRRVKRDDLVMNYMLAWKGAYGVSDYDGIVSPAYAVFEADRRKVDVRYLHHRLRSQQTRAQFRAASKGIIESRLRLYPDAFLALPVEIPDLPTQRAIADFLDRETARIDRLIEKKTRLVELIGQGIDSRIYRAVSGQGSSATARRRTEVAWFPEIPTHWEMKPLRHLALFQRGHDLPSDDRTSGDVPVVTSGGITSSHNSAMATGPGIVTGRYGTIGKFYFVESDYWPLNTTLYTRKLYGYPRYVWYLMKNMSHIFLLNSSKSAVPGVDRNDIHVEMVAVPPWDEQVQLARELDAHLAEANQLMQKVEKSIDLLHEMRSALITAAVTGQIDPATWGRRGETDRRLEAVERDLEAEPAGATV